MNMRLIKKKMKKFFNKTTNKPWKEVNKTVEELKWKYNQ